MSESRKEMIISALRLSASRYLNSSMLYATRKEQEIQSIQRWAFNEACKTIMVSNKKPIDALDELARKYDKAACLNENTSNMFSTAHDMVMLTIDLLIELEESDGSINIAYR